jgi:pyruvate dehydrogenase E1 component alpha subunit
MVAGPGAAARAASLGLQAVQVDGNDVMAVHAQAGELVRQIRQGGGPRLLHAHTYRVKGHVSVDLAAYRDPAELAAALETDPMRRAREVYAAAGGDVGALDRIQAEAEAEVAQSMQAADAAPWPDPASAYTDIQTTGEGQWF